MRTLAPSPVRIIGTGLIGGSLGMALRRAGVQVQVEDVSLAPPPSRSSLGVGELPAAGDRHPVSCSSPHRPTSPRPWSTGAAPLAGRAGRRCRERVKTTVLEGLRRLARPEDLPRYVGAHPMAGREVSGVIAARADLFQGRPFVVVPHEETLPTRSAC